MKSAVAWQKVNIIKNLNGRQRFVSALVIVLMVLAGLLLARQLVGAASPEGWIQLEPVVSNYDWGVSKPGGKDAEYQHKAILDNEFRVYINTEPGERGERQILVNIPQPWSFEVEDLLWTRTYDVEYEDLEKGDVRTRSFFSLEDCAPPIWTTNSSHYTNIFKNIDGSSNTEHLGYQCISVKLKGNISGGGPLPDNDTHLEWTFITPIPVPLEDIYAYTQFSFTRDSGPVVADVGQTDLQRRFSVTFDDEDTEVSRVHYLPHPANATLQSCAEPGAAAAQTASRIRTLTDPNILARGGGVYMADIESDRPSLCVYVYYRLRGFNYGMSYYYLPANDN